MCCPETKKGQLIADKLRKTLFNLELEKVNAMALVDKANADALLYEQLGNKEAFVEAVNRSNIYSEWLVNVTGSLEVAKRQLDSVLARYSPKYQTIWTMYFIEQAQIDDICRVVHYSRGNVNVIIKKLKDDMNGEEDNNIE